jgi:2,4-didehydro-3-deoxy-L-rhamnonate hydrolase
MRLVGVLMGQQRWIAVEGTSGPKLVGQVDRFYADVPAGLALAAAIRESAEPLAHWTPCPPIPETAKVLCAGLNYAAHAEESNMAAPEHPDVFGRWASTLVSPGVAVPVPAGEPGLDWEGELAAIVGQRLRNASAEEVEAAIVGYSCFNDLSARVHQLAASQWAIGKNADKSGPIGPALVTPDEVGDPYNLRLRTRVNGALVQDTKTSNMIFTAGQIGAYASECITLQPGDVIATGTPQGVGATRKPPVFLTAGHVVEVEIERIGVLVNPICDAEPIPAGVRKGARHDY